jgi:hypothetical protein
MVNRRIMLIVCWLGLAALAAVPAAAQGGIQVTGIRNLTFGTVLPGVPTHVLRTDPVRSGQFEVRAPPPKTVVLTLTLPTVLNGPLGATMPLSFATNDAGFSSTNVITSQVAFNPLVVYTAAMVNNRVGIFLGGTVSPSPTQRAGAYTGTVVLSVVVL